MDQQTTDKPPGGELAGDESTRPRTCPCCQGQRLIHGHARMGVGFSFWRSRTAKRCFVCLACGYVGVYFDGPALAKIRAENEQT